jgi:4-amino-4-deoxy-L-arabinose transferase-like glycosyltransferase
MNEPRRTQQTVAGLLLLCFLLYFWELGQIPFYNYEESKEALIVWEMMNDGGWILPLRNGLEIPLKPPLFHWCGALIALLSGKVNEFAVRSPSAFFSTASVFMVFFFGQRFWNWRVGLLASLVLATSPEWVRWATYARSDMALVFFLTAASLTFFRVWEERATRRRSLYAFYLFIGLATLAKGPLGIVLPVVVSVTFLALSRDLPLLRQMRLFEGAAIVSLIAASWYLLALEHAGWEFFRRQVLNENIYRFFDSEQGGPSRDHAWYYYGPALCAGMLPWSLFFPALAHFLYRSREKLQDPKTRYLLVWFIAGLIFFTLASGKRTNYILPLYPAAALLFAVWWEALTEGALASSVWATRLARVNAFILSAVSVLVFLFLIAHSAGFDLDHIVSPFLHPRDRANLPMVAYSLQSQFSVVVIWLLMLAFATVWYFWGLKQDQWMSVFAALTVATSSSLYFTNALFHPMLAWERTYKPFMIGVRSTVKNAPLYFYKDAYDYGAIFYANRHIPSHVDDLSTLKIDEHSSEPHYLLMWEEEWQTLSASADQRLEHLVTSEGKGPDKKHRLVLAALLPKREQAQANSQSPPPSTEAVSDAEASASAATQPIEPSAPKAPPETVSPAPALESATAESSSPSEETATQKEPAPSAQPTPTPLKPQTKTAVVAKSQAKTSRTVKNNEKNRSVQRQTSSKKRSPSSRRRPG